MKRTLTVVLTAAAFLVPAGAASAAPSPQHVDASCNNAKGGNGKGEFSGHGRLASVPGACLPADGQLGGGSDPGFSM